MGKSELGCIVQRKSVLKASWAGKYSECFGRRRGVVCLDGSFREMDLATLAGKKGWNVCGLEDKRPPLQSPGKTCQGGR